MNKNWRRWIGLGVGASILALIFYNLSRSPEWRNFRWDRLWASITGARLNLLVIALISVYCTYLVRAVRWRFFLYPIKRASLWVLFVGQVLGFSSIFLVGRPGELVRPAYIAKRENVPMSAMIAVWLLERVFDTIAMVLVFAASIYFEPVGPATAKGVSALHAMHEGGHLLFGFTAVLVVALVLFRWRAAQTTALTLKLFRFLPERALHTFAHFLHCFGEGLSVIRDWEGLAGSVVTTAALWTLNTTVFWLVFKKPGRRAGTPQLVSRGSDIVLRRLGIAGSVPGHRGGLPGGSDSGLDRNLQRCGGTLCRRQHSALDYDVSALPGPRSDPADP